VLQKERRLIVDAVYNLRDGLPSQYVSAIQPSKHWLWAGTFRGLARLPIASGGKVEAFGAANGLRHPGIGTLAEDIEGNLWIGTMGGGASSSPQAVSQLMAWRTVSLFCRSRA
jgi:ligand-binding sensor domain-containing protein